MARFRLLIAMFAALALFMAACGDDGDDGGDAADDAVTTTAAPADDAPADDAPADDAPADGATVTVVTSDLGEILADGEGRTLYVFTVDGPNTSNCTGECLAAWPRYAPESAVAGDGIDDSLLGAITIDDVEQLTIAEQPLYYFSGDAGPGDVNGQGVGGNWFVVGADGTAIESA